MNYLGWLRDKGENAVAYATANNVISDNEVMQYLKSKGYKLYNYSIFDIDGQPSRFNQGLFSFKLKLITDKTLLNRMEKDLLWHINVSVGGKVDWVAEKMLQRFESRQRDVFKAYKEDNRRAGDAEICIYSFNDASLTV